MDALRRKRNSRALNYYNDILARENASIPAEERVFDSVRLSRNHNIKIINENKKRLGDKIVKTRAEVKRKIELGKAPEVEKNERAVQNNNITSLIAGFLDSRDKKKYIKQNSKSFKGLEAVQQRTLFNLYMKYI